MERSTSYFIFQIIKIGNDQAEFTAGKSYIDQFYTFQLTIEKKHGKK